MKGKLDFCILKDTREELDITIKQLCEDLHMEVQTYKSIENGQFLPNKKTLSKICKYLKLDIKGIYDENFKNTRVLSFVNNKGGGGKTSVSSSLAYALSELGYKVLCIDADMQGDFTHSFNLETDTYKNLAQAIIKEDSLIDYIISSEYPNIDFVVYNMELSTIELIMFNKQAREEVLKRILNDVLKAGIYDFILIDTNPTLSVLNFNVINVSHYCLPTIQLGAYSLEGLQVLLEFINSTKAFNPNFIETKFIINNYDKRKKRLIQKTETWLNENYSDKLLKTIINVDTAIENAQLDGVPVLKYDPKSRIATDFRNLAKEIVTLVQ